MSGFCQNRYCGSAILKHWNQLFIHPEDDTSDDDVRDFVEWVCRKAERLGFKVELKTYQTLWRYLQKLTSQEIWKKLKVKNQLKKLKNFY